ncbi:popeye domain-containing protein 3 [Sigmodon hispidus]
MPTKPSWGQLQRVLALRSKQHPEMGKQETPSAGFIWAWVDVCAADIFSWNFVLFVICFMKFVHIAYQVHSITFAREFQFLDSPEWDSLRPTEEGIFQVTLTAETDCRYVSWRRKKLYLLFAQHRYISRLFSILIGSDIADKLYALNDRVVTGKKHHYDIRLPNYYQMSSPNLSRSPLTEQFRNSRQHCTK